MVNNHGVRRALAQQQKVICNSAVLHCQQRRTFLNDPKNKAKLNEGKEKIKGMLPEPPKAFFWNWLSTLYTYGLYNPLFRNTKDKFLRLFSGLTKSKEQQEWEQRGYFGRFFKQYQDMFQQRTQGTFEFYNPFSRQRSYVKRTLIYYGSILLGFILILKSFPLIFANLLSGPRSPQVYQQYPPPQQQSAQGSSLATDKDIQAL